MVINNSNRQIIFKGMLILLLHFLSNQLLNAQTEKKSMAAFFYNQTPPHLYDIILSRPTDRSITFSILCDDDIIGYLQYDEILTGMNKRTSEIHFQKGIANSFVLNGLQSDKRYYYRFVYRKLNISDFEKSTINYFQTQRKEGNRFVFDIQADSHLDENTGTEMYARTLRNICEDSADFLVDLGDTWMTDKYSPTFKDSYKQYIAQRYYFGIPGRTTSVFLTLGNHDGESEKRRNDTGNESMLAWATTIRKQYYCNPEPDDFYKGCMKGDQNYYSWDWGNALFIVLDPFRYTQSNRDPWNRTLGKTQYDWLEETLSKSTKKFKFIFIHNLVGGADNKGLARGGVEASAFFEWGGLNIDSTNGFSAHRPDWAKPIHNLLVEHHVSAVFHGHDHVFVKQIRDNIIYQTLPQPGAERYGNISSAADYGYRSGIIMNAPGYLRVTLEKDSAKIDFIQSAISELHKNKMILHSYSISSK